MSIKPKKLTEARELYKVMHLDGSGTQCPVLYYGPDRKEAMRIAAETEKAGLAISMLLITEIRSTYDTALLEWCNGPR